MAECLDPPLMGALAAFLPVPIQMVDGCAGRLLYSADTVRRINRIAQRTYFLCSMNLQDYIHNSSRSTPTSKRIVALDSSMCFGLQSNIGAVLLCMHPPGKHRLASVFVNFHRSHQPPSFLPLLTCRVLDLKIFTTPCFEQLRISLE